MHQLMQWGVCVMRAADVSSAIIFSTRMTAESGKEEWGTYISRTHLAMITVAFQLSSQLNYMAYCR